MSVFMHKPFDDVKDAYEFGEFTDEYDRHRTVGAFSLENYPQALRVIADSNETVNNLLVHLESAIAAGNLPMPEGKCDVQVMLVPGVLPTKWVHQTGIKTDEGVMLIAKGLQN